MSEESDKKAANRCHRCHRALKDPASMARGYGPICIVKEAKERMQAKELAEAVS